MQHDEVIWQVVGHSSCSFRSRLLYVYMKSIERAHAPNKLWERVKLPRNYTTALGTIDKHMAKACNYACKASTPGGTSRSEGGSCCCSCPERKSYCNVCRVERMGTFTISLSKSTKRFWPWKKWKLRVTTANTRKDRRENPEVEFVEGYEMEDEVDFEDFDLGMKGVDSDDDTESEEDQSKKQRGKIEPPSVVQRPAVKRRDDISSKPDTKRRNRREDVEIEYEQEHETPSIPGF